MGKNGTKHQKWSNTLNHKRSQSTKKNQQTDKQTDKKGGKFALIRKEMKSSKMKSSKFIVERAKIRGQWQKRSCFGLKSKKSITFLKMFRFGC